MAIFTPGQVTFNGKEAMSLAEAIVEKAYNKPAITDFHSLREGIKAKTQIPYLGRLPQLGVKRESCSTTPDSAAITRSEKFWNPCRLGTRLEFCWTELLDTLFIWGTKNGISKEDLQDTDFANYIIDLFSDAIYEAQLRHAWFGDVDAALTTASPAGNFLTGTNLNLFNCFDGLWKQLFAITVTDSNRKVSISKNGEASFANQAFNATDTTNKVAIGIMESLMYNADYRLRDQENKVIIATQSLVDQYVKELRSYTNVDASYQRIEGGYTSISFEGTPIIGFNFFDRIIRAYQQDGVKYYRPHRAVLTTKENLAIGTEEASSLSDFASFYDQYQEKYVVKGYWNEDAKVIEDYLVQVAF